MRIDRIFIIGHRLDLRWTRCCVASIRRWYPTRRITLIKDEWTGAYDTSDLERCFDVDLFPSTARHFGWGLARLEPMFLEPRERALVLDSDIVFAGPVLDRLERFDEEFIVEGADHSGEDLTQNYFDPAVVRAHFPDFRDPGFVFNVGQMVITSGILKREMFEPFVEFSEPRRLLRPDVFFCSDQGILNFVISQMAARGELRIRRDMFMRWPPCLRPDKVTPERLEHGPPYDFLLHWAGRKNEVLSANPLPAVLRYFEQAYYARVNATRLR